MLFGNITHEKTNQWNWERVGPFNVPAGVNIITLDRPYKDTPQEFMAIFVDEFTITTDANFLPANDLDKYLTTETFSYPQGQTQGEIIPQFESGSYICYLQAFGQQTLVDAFGNSPLKSNSINLIISP